MRGLRLSGPVRGPELAVHPPFGPMPTDPPAGAGGMAAFCPRNFLLSSSWESSKWGSSPGLAGSGATEKYGCFNASMAFIRFRQSRRSSSESREVAMGPWLLRRQSVAQA
jgi:hypothetical protein